MSRIVRPLGWLVVPAAFGMAIASSSPAGQPEPGKSPGRVGQAQRSPTKDDPAGSTPAKRAPGGIIISRETTFITGPLRADGSVDYLAALNERCSQGVTPENNAAVLLLQAVGPGVIAKPVRERFFQMLGVAPPLEKGPYSEGFHEYFLHKQTPPLHPRSIEETMEAIQRDFKDLIESANRNQGNAEPTKKKRVPDPYEIAATQDSRIHELPWSKAEFPIAAKWLEDNQKPLDLIVAAANRPRYYVPLPRLRVPRAEVAGDPWKVGEALWPLIGKPRQAARDLIARAMFHIGADESEEAWQDLLACHRLARLVDQGPLLADSMVAIAIDSEAAQGDTVLAHEGKLTSEQGTRFAAELRRLRPLGELADKMNWGERLVFLEELYATACPTPEEAAALATASGSGQGKFAWLKRWLASTLVNREGRMRLLNRWYDRLVTALSKPTRKERDAAIAEFERDFKQVAANVGDPRVLLRNVAIAGSLCGGLSRQLDLHFIAKEMFAPSGYVLAQDRATGSQSLVPVVFALAAYRADHGAYPAELAALGPKYLPAIPEDPFSGAPIRYKREGAGYMLYSVGPNGKDDGGRASWDNDQEFPGENNGCDDIAIRIPAKKK